MASPDLFALRLLRAYRGYRAGDLISVPQRLAETLVAQGVAQSAEPSAGLFDPKPVERAVAPGPMEVR